MRRMRKRRILTRECMSFWGSRDKTNFYEKCGLVPQKVGMEKVLGFVYVNLEVVYGIFRNKIYALIRVGA